MLRPYAVVIAGIYPFSNMPHTKYTFNLFRLAALSLIAALLLGTLAASAVAQSPNVIQIENPPDIRTAEVALDFRFQADAFTTFNAYPRETGVFVPGSSGQGSVISAPITVTLPNPEPFLAIGTLWQANFDAFRAIGGGYTVSVRGTSDGETWSEWQLFADYFFTQSGEELASDLITLDRATTQVQIRLDWEREQNIPDTLLQRVRIVFVSPGATPPHALEAIERAGEQSPTLIGAAVTKPPVTSRTAWGCPEGQTSPDWTPEYTSVTHLIVHHTVNENNTTDWPAAVRAIWNYHTNTLEWGDIGYNYLIDPNGVIYEGRAGGDNVIGAHFSCMNSNTMGVALLGDFRSAYPTTAARSSLEGILAWKADQLGLSPTGTAYHLPAQMILSTISGHRDGNASTQGCPSGTVCPGDALHSLLPSIRTNVQARTGTSTLPANTNLVRNSLFTSSLAEWQTWGDLDWQIVGGVLNLRRYTGSSNWAALYQNIGYAAPANSPFELNLKLGATSGEDRLVTVSLHQPSTWAGALTCTFRVPAYAPAAIYTLRGKLASAWSGVFVELNPANVSTTRDLTVDDVALYYRPSLSVGSTQCIEPSNPYPNLVTNGDFSAGMTGWAPWDAITHNSGAGGVFEFYRNLGGSSAAVLQGTGADLVNGSTIEATFNLGNSSGVRKRVVAIVHEGDFSDSIVCSFWLPPNTPLRIYTLRGQTSKAWTNATVAFYATPADSLGWIRLDNVTLRHIPGLPGLQTRCIDPSAPG
jgi:hypothetical protein